MAGIISCIHTYWLLFPVFFEILTYAQENEIISFKEGNQCNKQDKKFQSPINIDVQNVKQAKFPVLTLTNLTRHSNAKLKVTNTGHTLNINLNDEAYLTGGPLSKTYLFQNLHFHWGKSDLEGSEHQINHHKFPLEAHFVFDRSYKIQIPVSCLEKIKQEFCHKKNKLDDEQCIELSRFSTKFRENHTADCINNINKHHCSDTYRTIDAESSGGEIERITTLRAEKIAIKNAECELREQLEAYKNSKDMCKKNAKLMNSLTKQIVNVKVVIATFFQLSNIAPNYRLLELAKDIVPVSATKQVPFNQLFEFVFRMKTAEYYMYTGSLTTPPHTDNVIWIVLNNPLLISSNQLELLRNLQSGSGGKIIESFRQLQDLENRVVYSTCI